MNFCLGATGRGTPRPVYRSSQVGTGLGVPRPVAPIQSRLDV